MNIQSKLIEIHAKYGVTEMANYHIQKLFDTELCAAKKDFYESGKANGVIITKREYEEKLRWIPIYEPPKTAELVIVDSGENLHACVAVAFFENGIWKYANGQKLWFAPRRWRSFL